MAGRRQQEKPLRNNLVGRVFLELLIGTVLIGGVSSLLRTAFLNPTTVALVLLVVVLLISGWRGTLGGVISSLLATGSLNFLFLPPLHTWNVDDPGNWIALACFLAASILAGRLVTLARREATLAEARRTEVESLYWLSVELFHTTTHDGGLEEAAKRSLEAASAAGGGLVQFEGSFYHQRTICWVGDRGELDEDVIAGAGRHRRVVELPAPKGRLVYLPLLIGGRCEGVFVVRQSSMTTSSLENIATLLGLAAERERLFREQAHVEALRESERLKTSLLRAVSHDLASPLTALTLHAGRIRRVTPSEGLSVVDALEQELSSLRRRIDKLLTFARLEAGAVRPSPEPTPPADLFRSVRESLSTIERRRDLLVDVDNDCPDLFVDPSIALEVMVNLVENADRASPPDEPITMRAARASSERVFIQVEDHGPGMPVVPAAENDPYGGDAGGKTRRGLGLEIVEGLLMALDGTLSFRTSDDGWNLACVELPGVTTPIEVDR